MGLLSNHDLAATYRTGRPACSAWIRRDGMEAFSGTPQFLPGSCSAAVGVSASASARNPCPAGLWHPPSALPIPSAVRPSWHWMGGGCYCAASPLAKSHSLPDGADPRNRGDCLYAPVRICLLQFSGGGCKRCL